MRQPNSTERQLRIVSFQKTLRNVRVAAESYYLMRATGLENQEAKMAFKIDVRDVRRRRGKRYRRK